ncbi:TPA: conjugal transfer protein TrbE [Klebsiella pneumoniae]
MKMSFHKKPVIDFVLRLTLTIIIISPVIYFSWDAVKGTSGSDYVESVVFILMAGFAGNDSNLLIVFYVQIVPDDFVMQLHRF